LNTDKKHIKNLAKICASKGMKHVVLSPGSRCAPLVIAFNREPSIECVSVVDERSAAFFALGIAQQTLSPVGLVCTSGSAILNYAPAIAEAFYQKIPLIIFTADRPNEWIDQGENQSIQQFEVYKNYIKKSFQLPTQVIEDKDLWYAGRIISEALNASLYPDFGPIHVNVPLREPLYNLEEDNDPAPKIIEFPVPEFHLSEQTMQQLGNEWNNAKKKLIVVGGHKKRHAKLEKSLQQLSENEGVVVFKESISNVYGNDFIDCIDPVVETITHFNLHDFKPDLVITFGGGVVSKKLKFWLRNNNPKAHWHITKSFEHWDNFQSLSKVIQVDAEYFIEKILTLNTNSASDYKKKMLSLDKMAHEITHQYIQGIPFSDFCVFDFLVKNMPENSNIHFGNSTPVRYANLLKSNADKNLLINSNRGVSGIDGVSSTAAGAAYAHPDILTLCIVGDIAFQYDINALWNRYLTPNLKMIVINNGGGNIFKIIPGPDKLQELETYFETGQQRDVKLLAESFGFAYFKASDMDSLQNSYTNLINESAKPAVLEVFTHNHTSADALKNYFSYIRQNMKPE
jgi:2-succinyl-5-enolpyruvyl-6-hydroxy-3-cyclohexene-1-carboxylate synthase